MHHLKDGIKSVAHPGVILPREIAFVNRETPATLSLGKPTVAVDVYQGWQIASTVHVLHHHGSAFTADFRLA